MSPKYPKAMAKFTETWPAQHRLDPGRNKQMQTRHVRPPRLRQDLVALFARRWPQVDHRPTRGHQLLPSGTPHRVFTDTMPTTDLTLPMNKICVLLVTLSTRLSVRCQSNNSSTPSSRASIKFLRFVTWNFLKFPTSRIKNRRSTLHWWVQ